MTGRFDDATWCRWTVEGSYRPPSRPWARNARRWLPAAEVEKRLAKRGVKDLQYYNGALHHGLFALPNFVRTLTAVTDRPRILPKRRVAGGK